MGLTRATLIFVANLVVIFFTWCIILPSAVLFIFEQTPDRLFYPLSLTCSGVTEIDTSLVPLLHPYLFPLLFPFPG